MKLESKEEKERKRERKEEDTRWKVRCKLGAGARTRRVELTENKLGCASLTRMEAPPCGVRATCACLTIRRNDFEDDVLVARAAALTQFPPSERNSTNVHRLIGRCTEPYLLPLAARAISFSPSLLLAHLANLNKTDARTFGRCKTKQTKTNKTWKKAQEEE